MSCLLVFRKLKRIISIARGQIGRLHEPEVDPDIPECYYWDENQVGDWMAEIGYPELKVKRDHSFSFLSLM